MECVWGVFVWTEGQRGSLLTACGLQSEEGGKGLEMKGVFLKI
jgi:hypothetical protein